MKHKKEGTNAMIAIIHNLKHSIVSRDDTNCSNTSKLSSIPVHCGSQAGPRQLD